MAQRHGVDPALRLQSVVPGRQRWEAPVVLGRPRAAEALEAVLRRSPGITEAHASAVTGRVLIRHDGRVLGPKEAARVLRQAVGLVVGRLTAPRRPATRASASDAPPASTDRTGDRRRSVLVGGAAAVVALGGAKVLLRPLVSFGAVAVATAVVVRRAWRKAARSRPDPLSGETPKHPLSRIVGPHRREFALASLLSIGGQVVEMALGLFIGWIALVLIKGESAALVKLGLAGASTQLWALAGVTGLVCVAVAGLSYASGVSWRRLGQAIQHDWRKETYPHVQRLELPHLEGERTTRIAGVLAEDINQLGNFVGNSAHEVIQLVTSFAVLVPVFLLMAPQIAWIAFAPIPVIAWLSFYYHDRTAADYAVSGENRAQLQSRLINNLEASATVKSFCAEDHEAERVDRLSEICRESNEQTDRGVVMYTENVRICATASMAGMLLLGGRAVLNGTLPFEVFSPLIGLPQQVLWKLTRLGGTIDQYQRTLSAFDRVEHLRGLPVEPVADGRRLEAAGVKGEVVLDGVTFSYPGRPPALRDLSLRIAPRQVTGIVGATGSGKTTIAKLLMRFYEADSGRILLDGQDIRELSLPDLRRAVGFVAQDAHLFDGTVAENIGYGSFGLSRRQVVDSARLADADSFIAALPQGYDTVIGERGATLSGGQRQRIALARAILKDSPIVVLDEATSAVDNETEAAIQRALQKFAADRTMIVIAHRLSTIRHADWIYAMDKGGVVAEEGTHDALLERNGLYASLWNLQAGDKHASLASCRVGQPMTVRAVPLPTRR
ncbi:ABC transporter ATP-binding protein/permease [Kitasatospora aureofaciens]|uniref:ABC transporter ATP-binding protein/permease n=1 Tax=Kitasatospora aureofaciens TaxID=1894 RepID=UPI0027DF0ED9|nr:ATP-binding cassette domain-containing protein [Kitasatospora aureofaciens]